MCEWQKIVMYDLGNTGPSSITQQNISIYTLWRRKRRIRRRNRKKEEEEEQESTKDIVTFRIHGTIYTVCVRCNFRFSHSQMTSCQLENIISFMPCAFFECQENLLAINCPLGAHFFLFSPFSSLGMIVWPACMLLLLLLLLLDGLTSYACATYPKQMPFHCRPPFDVRMDPSTSAKWLNFHVSPKIWVILHTIQNVVHVFVQKKLILFRRKRKTINCRDWSVESLCMELAEHVSVIIP